MPRCFCALVWWYCSKTTETKEGNRICCEIIEQVRELPGVAGLHIMAVHWTEAVPEIVTRSGLY
jgi:5,10-methylenetetrahydrofolate reductase